MKTQNILHFVAGLAAVSVVVGCAKKVVVQDPPPPQPTVTAAATQDPPPPAEEKPNFVGLPLTGSQIDVLGNIEFDTASDKIKQTPQTIGILTTLATAGKAYPQITKLRVEGHTDTDGNEANNQQLSERRAQAVVRWLTDNGIEANRLIGVGCGSRDPLADNTTPEGKQRNRRTEFDIEEAMGKRFELATDACAPNPARKK